MRRCRKSSRANHHHRTITTRPLVLAVTDMATEDMVDKVVDLEEVVTEEEAEAVVSVAEGEGGD